MSARPPAEEPGSKPFGFDHPDFDAAQYGETAKCAKLAELRQIKCEFYLKSEQVEFGSSRLELGESAKFLFNGKRIGFDFEEDIGTCFGEYSWSAQIKSGREKIMSLRTLYFVTYFNLEGHPQEYVQLYFEKIARFATYPYFRSTFATMVANAGIVMQPLPSLTDRID